MDASARRALQLVIADNGAVDLLPGPGSASSEGIPAVSPVLSSPLTTSFDPHFQPVDETDPENAPMDDSDSDKGSDSGEKQGGLHVIVVGGDVGAFATALALARSEGVSVTLVNAGLTLGLGHGGLPEDNGAVRAVQLGARTISLLQSLDGEKPTYESWEGGLETYSSGRANRWKGKGRFISTKSIVERLREDGVYCEGYTLRRYKDNEFLTRQTYYLTGQENAAVLSINLNRLHAVLLDACLDHPRIHVRPRAVVNAVLPGEDTPLTNVPQTQKVSADHVDANDNAFKRVGIGRRLDVGSRGRKARESFIQFDDEDFDLGSAFLSAPPAPRTPSEDGSIEDILSAYNSDRPDLFTSSDLVDDVSAIENNSAVFSIEQIKLRPAVLLTSGEMLEADAVLGSEGPLSKVLDAVLTSHSDAHGGERKGLTILREDGIYRACIPIAKLSADPELRTLVGDDPKRGTDITTWIGPDHHVTGFPIGGWTYYVNVVFKGSRAREILYFDNDGRILAERMKNEVAGWCDIVKKLVNLVDSATYSSTYDYSILETWISKSGRVAVLGDAAHPDLPFAHQGIDNIIADAITLGALFNKPFLHPEYYCSDRSRLVPHLLASFESLRRPRCIRSQSMLQTGRDLFQLPDGENQRRRDATLKEGGLLSEDEKRVEWLYDPLDVVRKWWEDETRDEPRFADPS
ncbi:hypothetical protein EW145_g7344 [Phellinidium pouzarii]|uniref:FAD-binding domain-containing protein n=1 Tax=Phellinidium pouzarii TaxID=167371 RepID=A0A4S4KKI5_9AGAM|nr:hypothetical protein EW145_g7344 [Phellinidium pouzarii]